MNFKRASARGERKMTKRYDKSMDQAWRVAAIRMGLIVAFAIFVMVAFVAPATPALAQNTEAHGQLYVGQLGGSMPNFGGGAPIYGGGNFPSYGGAGGYGSNGGNVHETESSDSDGNYNRETVITHPTDTSHTNHSIWENRSGTDKGFNAMRQAQSFAILANTGITAIERLGSMVTKKPEVVVVHEGAPQEVRHQGQTCYVVNGELVCPTNAQAERRERWSPRW